MFSKKKLTGRKYSLQIKNKKQIRLFNTNIALKCQFIKIKF